MTDEQILKLAETCDFIGLDDDRMLLCCDDELLKFSRAIRKETIEEVLTLLKDVPNPEANRTAINRIMSMNND
jgi:hypothetical protein